jgi:hypothetical protein
MPSIRNLVGCSVALCLAATALTTAVAAEPLDIRPGLWSTSSTTVMSGAPLYIEGMPAAGRADYAKQWAQTINKPIKDSDDEDCITAKDIREASMLDGLKKGENCKVSMSKQSSTAMAGVIECQESKTSTRTTIDYRAASPTSFSADLVSTVTSPNGVTTMKINMAGKWLAASCPADDEEDPGDESGSDEE